MQRKKCGIETAERIIEVAFKLFYENGYDKTTTQDISNISGVSKGAIFHHFKSKEDILAAVLDKQNEHIAHTLQKWANNLKRDNAREKIIALLERSIKDRDVLAPLDCIISSQQRDPRFVVSNMLNGVNKSAPIVAKLLRDGKNDGSISTNSPDECAEIFFLLISTWCDNNLFGYDTTLLEQRLNYIREIMQQMGADIVSEKYIKDFVKFIEKLHKEISKANKNK